MKVSKKLLSLSDLNGDEKILLKASGKKEPEYSTVFRFLGRKDDNFLIEEIRSSQKFLITKNQKIFIC